MFDQCTDTPALQNSLKWQAMQYVLGEMSEGESLAFEGRLATDTMACSAVAETARLVLTLQVAAASDAVFVAPERRTQLHSARRSWFALGSVATAASCLFAAMWLFPRDHVSQPSPVHLVRQDRSAVELVSMWRLSSAAPAVELDDLDLEQTEARSAVAVPNWLLAAVSLEQASSIGGNPNQQQEN